MFPGLTEGVQDCSFSRRGSITQILMWGLRSDAGVSQFADINAMFSHSAPAAPGLFPATRLVDVYSRHSLLGLILPLPFIAVVSPNFSYFFSLPVSLLLSIRFFLNFPFSEGFTDHSRSRSVQPPDGRCWHYSVIAKPGFAKTKWAKLNAC